jgi:hypothetical protein
MKNPFTRASLPTWTSALAAAAMAIPAGAAGVKNQITNYSYSTNPGTFKSGYTHYVDFSDTTKTAGHFNYASMTNNGGQVKYMEYTEYVYNASPARCYTLATSNTVNPALPTADTEILVKNSQGAWVKLSDDSQLYGSYAFARIYFYSGSNTRTTPKIRIASFSNYHIKEAFQFQSAWFTDDFNACLEGIPALPGSLNMASAYIDANNNVTIRRAL